MNGLHETGRFHIVGEAAEGEDAVALCAARGVDQPVIAA